MDFRQEALHLFVLYHIDIESICNVFSELKHIPTFVAGSQSDYRVFNIGFPKDSLLPRLSRFLIYAKNLFSSFLIKTAHMFIAAALLFQLKDDDK